MHKSPNRKPIIVKTHNNKYLLVCFLFFLLICLIRQMPFVIDFDYKVYMWAIDLSYSKLWLKFWYFWTVLGSAKIIYALMLVVSFILLKNNFKLKSFSFIIMMFALGNSNAVLKILFQIERPVCLASFYPEPTTYTFPSGHAFASVILFYFLPRLLYLMSYKTKSLSLPLNHSKRYRVYLSLPFMFTGIGLISLSRVFLGVHWFSDIVAGVLWGFVISLVFLWLYNWLGIESSSQNK